MKLGGKIYSPVGRTENLGKKICIKNYENDKKVYMCICNIHRKVMKEIGRQKLGSIERNNG